MMGLIGRMRRRSQTKTIRLQRAGAMTDQQVKVALQYSEDSPLIRALHEIRARLEDRLAEEAFHGDDATRLRNLARIEGVNEFLKVILDKREPPVPEP